MNRRSLALVAALLAVTALLASLHLHTRADVAPGSLLVMSDGAQQSLSVDALPLVAVEGSIVDGKGEERQIRAEGIALADALALAGAEVRERVTVVAADEYAAALTVDELGEPGKVWLICDGDGLRLIVFGDENAKRDVKSVERVEVE